MWRIDLDWPTSCREVAQRIEQVWKAEVSAANGHGGDQRGATTLVHWRNGADGILSRLKRDDRSPSCRRKNYHRTTKYGVGAFTMDKARLRANARELRTVLTELGIANQAYNDRILREVEEQSDASIEVMRQVEKGEQVDWRKPIDYEPTDEERSNITHASGQVLGNLAKQFLALTEELAGDIDQDKTTWKPPPE